MLPFSSLLTTSASTILTNSCSRSRSSSAAILPVKFGLGESEHQHLYGANGHSALLSAHEAESSFCFCMSNSACVSTPSSSSFFRFSSWVTMSAPPACRGGRGRGRRRVLLRRRRVLLLCLEVRDLLVLRLLVRQRSARPSCPRDTRPHRRPLRERVAFFSYPSLVLLLESNDGRGCAATQPEPIRSGASGRHRCIVRSPNGHGPARLVGCAHRRADPLSRAAARRHDVRAPPVSGGRLRRRARSWSRTRPRRAGCPSCRRPTAPGVVAFYEECRREGGLLHLVIADRVTRCLPRRDDAGARRAPGRRGRLLPRPGGAWARDRDRGAAAADGLGVRRRSASAACRCSSRPRTSRRSGSPSGQASGTRACCARYWEHGDGRLDVIVLARLPGDDRSLLGVARFGRAAPSTSRCRAKKPSATTSQPRPETPCSGPQAST